MTTEPDLLPLPEWMNNYIIPADGFECDKDVVLADRMRDYARANVARAVAPLQAEIEALRAEVAFGRKLNADLIHACALANIHSERLEEALWLIESAKDRGFGIDYARGVAQSALLRDQEEGK